MLLKILSIAKFIPKTETVIGKLKADLAKNFSPTYSRAFNPELFDDAHHVKGSFFPNYSDHTVSNDNGFGAILKELPKMLSEVIKDDEVSAALLFGESHLLSCLPELAPFALIIIGDLFPNIFHSVQEQLTMLQRHNTPTGFAKEYFDTSPSYDRPAHYAKIPPESKLYFIQRFLCKDLFKYGFLSSQERYTACQEAAKRLQISFVELNILDKEMVDKFRQCLSDSSVSLKLINITNIQDYATKRADLTDRLKELPPHDSLVMKSMKYELISCIQTLESFLSA